MPTINFTTRQIEIAVIAALLIITCLFMLYVDTSSNSASPPAIEESLTGSENIDEVIGYES